MQVPSAQAAAAAIAALWSFGEGGGPVFLPLCLLLPQLPLVLVELIPNPIWIYFTRRQLDLKFPLFGRKHHSSSPVLHSTSPTLRVIQVGPLWLLAAKAPAGFVAAELCIVVVVSRSIAAAPRRRAAAPVHSSECE